MILSLSAHFLWTTPEPIINMNVIPRFGSLMAMAADTGSFFTKNREKVARRRVSSAHNDQHYDLVRGDLYLLY